MTAVVIQGGGKKNNANVDDNNLLETKSFTQTFEQLLTAEGRAFNLNTGSISFTGTSEAAVTYLKNNEDDKLIITAFIYLLGNTTGGSGSDSQVKVIENPTSGTILTATAGTPKNRNFGSKNTLNVDWRIGDSSKTSSGGTTAIESIFSGIGRQVVSVPTVLPKGASLSILYTPPSGNTSQNVQFAIAAYLDTLKLGD
jgi:hypothetical protein